ncbi:hypothetical protein MMC26_002000 [Xylographa opegraphella]|nr:hypothetical protein [Xylographa opegraphella]
MLRLPATKIDLGPRDLAWHIDRYRQRKVQYEEFCSVKGSLRFAHQTTQPFRCLPAQQAYVPQAAGVVVVDDALVCSEPVPRDSTAFWNGVLAIAGTPIQNSRSLPQERYSDVEFAASSSESHQTSNPSDPSSGFDELEVLHQGHEHGHHARNLRDIVEAGSRLAELRSQFSADSSQSSENGKDDPTNTFVDLEAGRGATPVRRRSFFSFRRAEHDGGTDEDISSLSRSFSSQLDFNDSHESMPRYGENEGEEDLATARAVPINRFVARPVLQHPTSGLRGQGSQLEDEEAELAETIASLHELIDGAVSPAPRLPTHIEHIRSRSGTVVRSPLYLTQAVASSSPERPRTASPYRNSLQPGSMTSLLSLPPRRAKQYKPQSHGSLAPQTYYDSHDIYQATNPERDEVNGPQNLISTSDSHSVGSPSIPPRAYASAVDSFTSSPPLPSPQSDTTTQLHAHAHSPSLPPLPPPFSSTRRLLSFNLALPSSSSPTSPFTSPAPHASPTQTHSPRTSTPHRHNNPFHSLPSRSATPLPHHSTPSPSSPPTPHRSTMRIYNDALPALAQPQTPLGLPRHGVHAGAYYTAPVRGNRRDETQDRGGEEERGYGHNHRAVATHRPSPWHTATTTPTRTPWLRRSRARGLDEQENVGVHVEAERRLRWRARERERELERERWEMERPGGEEGG